MQLQPKCIRFSQLLPCLQYLPCVTGEFELEIHTDVHPEQNTSLEGLYKSGGNYCTQVRWVACERGGAMWHRHRVTSHILAG